MATIENNPELRATFIFKGTVKKLKAAAMENVPVDEATAVVHVDQVLEAPRSLAHCGGRDITVHLAAAPKAAAGQQFIFHATAWIFAKDVAVRAVRQERVSGAHAELLARQGDPVALKSDREFQERLTGADLVVSGKVQAVNLRASERQAAAATAISPVAQKPVSEHDPQWREAVVAVDKVHKGPGGRAQVSVVFPASRDVAWFKAPKFEAGQQGYFLLRKGVPDPAAPPGRAVPEAAVVEPAEAPEVYTALHPMDFQPYSQRARVNTAITAAESDHDQEK